MDAVRQLLEAVRGYEQGLDRCLVLHAAWSVLSPGARALFGSRLVDGNLAGRSKAWGAQNIGTSAETIEQLARSLTKKLFGTGHAEFRPLSGSLANGVASMALTAAGDTIVMPPAWAFGHKSLGVRGYPGVGGRRIVEMPWDTTKLGPDVDALRAVVTRERPALVILGLSRTLFPEPMTEVTVLARDAGARRLYDGAHVLGLIAGGVFPNPLEHGFELMTGSTHKTLPGPTGGIVLCREPSDLERVASLTDAWTATYGNNRIAALAYTLAELAAHGTALAARTVENARALAAALDAEGFTVVGKARGYTATHQVLLDVTELMAPEEASGRLVAGGVVVNPADRADRRLRGGRADGWWQRLGTPVLTRMGMGPKDMAEVARVLARLLRDREDPAHVTRSVVDLVARFSRVGFAIDA